jgi:hypothetical protein
MHLSDLLQVSALGGTRNEEFIGQMLSGRLPTVKDSCSKFDESKTSDAGNLSFLGNGEAKVTMSLLQTGQGKSRSPQDNAHCYELLAQSKANFRFALTAGMSEPECIFHIGKAHVEKLPLFLELVEVAREAETDASKQPQAVSSAQAQACKKQRVAADADASAITVPFKPPLPASASGLACLLLLLDEANSPLQLFSSPLCGPRLAIQCLSVRSTSCVVPVYLHKVCAMCCLSFERVISIYCCILKIVQSFRNCRLCDPALIQKCGLQDKRGTSGVLLRTP